MQIIIDIPSEMYDWFENGFTDEDDAEKLWQIVKNGTPLPKCHGDLVDFDKLCEEYWDGNYLEIHRDELASIQPIIEADKESEE